MKKALAILLAAIMLCIPTAVAAEDEVNYILSEELLAVGENTYNMSADYPYTLFALEPTEVGTYYVYATDAKICIISYNGMWAYFDPSDDNVTETSISWNCTSIGQSIWIAVKADSSTVTLNVTTEELVVVVIPKEIYKNTAELNPFTFDGNADDLVYVETFDDICDAPVLAEDGFYRLNSEKGPRLYVDLNDELMNLVDAMSYGQLKYNVVEDGKTVKLIDYNEALGLYANNADESTMLYPLTADLMEIYKNVGAAKGWYGENGWIGGEQDDAWMFACYYLEDDVIVDAKLGDVNYDGTVDKYDYILIKRAVMETYTLNDAQVLTADIDKNGAVDKFDYILLKRAVMGTYTIEG
jgi:hypothetical protein